MLKIMKKEIDLENSKVLYDEKTTKEAFENHWDIKSGEWCYDDGWFAGRNPENNPGMIVSKANFFGNVMVDFIGKTVLPSTHDINVMWNGSWDEVKNERDVAYVAGLEGWWEKKVGFEKSPEYILNAGTSLFDFEPGKEYHIQAGSIDGHVFVFIDGKLVLECTDPDPIDNKKYGRVGFEAYCSSIKIKDIVIRELAWRARKLSYNREF